MGVERFPQFFFGHHRHFQAIALKDGGTTVFTVCCAPGNGYDEPDGKVNGE